MRYLKLNSLSIFCFLLLQSALKADSMDVNYFTPQNIYRFADHLYHEGDYLRAAGEFQRYLFSFDSLPSNTDSVFYKMGLCYRCSGNLSKALEYFQNINDDYAESKLLDQSFYQSALCYFLMGRYEKSIIFLDSHLSLVGQDYIELRMEQLIGINYIQQKEWKKAIDFLNVDKNADSVTAQLVNFANMGLQLPRKNKGLAGLFSTVIPGAGKLYCNRRVDGFQSFLSTTITGWLAYDGFHNDGIKSVKGWIFGVMGGIFYLGNIYGSVVAAEIYNEEQEEKLLKKVKIFINVNLD